MLRTRMTKPSLHNLHNLTEGFESAALNYRIARPSYPKKVIDYLVNTFSLSTDSTICDLAAGTGKLTKPLVRHSGARVAAVEPVGPMREEFKKVLPRTPIVEGVAEKIPFKTGSFDLVTVAQAFHWFDIPKAQKEIRRVLKAHGGLAIIWSYKESFDWTRKADAIVHRYYEDHPYKNAMDWQAKFSKSRLFEQPLKSYGVRHAVTYTPETFLRSVFSVSAVALLDEKEKGKVKREVSRLLQGHPDLRGKDRFVVPHHIKIYWTRAL